MLCGAGDVERCCRKGSSGCTFRAVFAYNTAGIGRTGGSYAVVFVRNPYYIHKCENCGEFGRTQEDVSFPFQPSITKRHKTGEIRVFLGSNGRNLFYAFS